MFKILFPGTCEEEPSLPGLSALVLMIHYTVVCQLSTSADKPIGGSGQSLLL